MDKWINTTETALVAIQHTTTEGCSLLEKPFMPEKPLKWTFPNFTHLLVLNLGKKGNQLQKHYNNYQVLEVGNKLDV